MDKKSQEVGELLASEGIVLCVYESAFDVLIPEYGFEKRVHCDQLPLKKAEFRKETRVLELYWEKGVPSSAYVPEDERPKHQASLSSSSSTSRAQREAAASEQQAKARRESEEAMRKQTETGTMAADAVDALFDDDDDDDDVEEEDEDADIISGGGEASGVAISTTDRVTQSMPPSPGGSGSSGGNHHHHQQQLHHQQHAPYRTRSDPRMAISSTAGMVDDGDHMLTADKKKKEKYLGMFSLREGSGGGEYIQDVTEMTRVPIILKTDLSKSPP